MPDKPIQKKRGKQYSSLSDTGDPTYNVLKLVDKAVERLDDLRRADRHSNKEMIALNKEIIALHISYWEKLRLSDEKLSLAESKRIDAIRAVDVGAVAIASERSNQQASVLANQVAASADTLRSLVATTAATVATQFQTVTNQLMEKIALLEKSQYVGIGKERITDPIMTELLSEVKSLRGSRSTVEGAGAMVTKFIGWLIAAAAILYSLIKQT